MSALATKTFSLDPCEVETSGWAHVRDHYEQALDSRCGKEINVDYLIEMDKACKEAELEGKAMFELIKLERDQQVEKEA